MAAINILLPRLWMLIFGLILLGNAMGGCSKQYVGVATSAIRPPGELMVPPQELPKRNLKDPNIKDATRAWAEDRRIGGEAIRKLRDLQRFEKSRTEGRDQLQNAGK